MHPAHRDEAAVSASCQAGGREDTDIKKTFTLLSSEGTTMTALEEEVTFLFACPGRGQAPRSLDCFFLAPVVYLGTLAPPGWRKPRGRGRQQAWRQQKPKTPPWSPVWLQVTSSGWHRDVIRKMRSSCQILKRGSFLTKNPMCGLSKSVATEGIGLQWPRSWPGGMDLVVS